MTCIWCQNWLESQSDLWVLQKCVWIIRYFGIQLERIFLFITFFFRNVALQKRPLDCVMSNGTVLDPMLCNERDKPTQKRECFNENCRGTWKVSEWSHVSPLLLPTFFFSSLCDYTSNRNSSLESTNYLVIFFFLGTVFIFYPFPSLLIRMPSSSQFIFKILRSIIGAK